MCPDVLHQLCEMMKVLHESSSMAAAPALDLLSDCYGFVGDEYEIRAEVIREMLQVLKVRGHSEV